MKSCLNTLSNLLAAACAILFVIVAFTTLVVFIFSQTFFNSQTYKQALNRQDAYERFPGIIAEQLIYQENQINLGLDSGEGLNPDLARLTQADWEIVFSEIFTPASLQAQAESVIDQFIDYINTPGEPLKLKVSLVEFKEKLDGEAGLNALMQIIEAQPECTSDEWSRLLYAAQSAQLQDLPYCRPSDDILEIARPSLQQALHDVVIAIPSETYLDNRSGPASQVSSADDPREEIQRARRWITLSLCLPVIILFLVGVFGVRSLRGFGLWLGLPLMFTGLLTFLTALVTWILPSWLITRSFPSGEVTIEGAAAGVAQLVLDVGIEIAHTAARSMGIAGFLIGLVGLGLLAAGLLFGYVTRSDKLTYPPV